MYFIKTSYLVFTVMSYKLFQDLSTYVAVYCHCDAIRLIFMFQILKLIVDTAITLVTRNCEFDNQQIAC